MPLLRGAGGRAPLTTACAPPFRFAQNTFLKRHVMTSQQAIMEKEIITFKDNSRSKFLGFSRNCWQPTAFMRCNT